jgi:hypothetical protein
MGCGEASTSFCEKKEEKKLFIRFGDSDLSASPLLQGEWFFWFFFCKKRTCLISS